MSLFSLHKIKKTTAIIFAIFFIGIGFLLSQNIALAAVAHDAASESHTGTSGSTNQASFTWNHTPAGTPRGVLVFVYTDSATKLVTGVTYGGVAMTNITAATAIDTVTEPGRVDTYFLGSGILTGMRPIVVSRTNNATIMYASAMTQTALVNTEVYQAGIVLLQENGTAPEQSVTDGSPGTNSLRYAGLYTGLNTVPGAAGANSTFLSSIDIGGNGAVTARETTAGQGARSVGFAAATDDRAAVHLAIREIPATGSVSASPTSCTISSGASTCTVPFTWSISNASSPNLYNSTTASQYSTAASGTGVSYAITNGSNTVQARNSTTVLASTAVTASCISGTTWNGSSCAPSNAVPTVTTPTATSVTTSGATLGANVTSLGVPASISARGTCWGTTASPVTNCAAEGGTTTGVFTHVRTGMTNNTLYYYRGYATNTTGTGYSADGTFTTSATASGSVSASPSTCTILSGASTCTVPFTWSITNATSPNLYNATTATQYSTSASGTGVSYAITNGSNTVQVRDSSTVLNSATATGSCTSGTSWNGSTCAATPAIPTVTTPTATSVTTSGATLGANVTSLGIPASISARGTCWGTIASPVTNCTAEGGTTTGVFTHARTGMTNNTLYYYRGYATNSTGTGYSADGTFTTSSITGTISASPSTCTILSGASTCTVPFTWSITGASSPNLYNATTASTYSTSASGTGVSYSITNGSNTVQVRDSSTVLNSTTATGSCTAGTSWSGTLCSAITFEIFASSGAHGSVSPTGTTTVTQGGSQLYNITPDVNYGVETLLIDGGSVATSTTYTFSNVTAGRTISATFYLLPITHTIVSSAGSNGTISPLGSVVVADHASQAFNINPDTGFVIETLVVDSVSIATSTSYTFSDVTTGHTISATFALIPPPPGSFTIIATSGLHGTVSPNGSTVVTEGSSQSYTITPDSGYNISTLIIDSFAVATSTSYTFTNVTTAHTIEATFVAFPVAGAEVPSRPRLASVEFYGKAFPGGKISIVHKALGAEVAASQQDMSAFDGSFHVRFNDLPDGIHSFGLLIKDPDGRTSQTKYFTVDGSKKEEIIKGIVAPPTIDILSGQVSRGSNVRVFGYASPSHTIRVYINGILNKEVLAGRGGVYSFDIPTGVLDFGQYTVRTKQINLDGGKESDFSTSRTFVVSKLAVVKADLSGDGKIDIRDWSIFLARFTSKDPEIRKSIDLSGDGKADISDFSIFIKTLRKK